MLRHRVRRCGGGYCIVEPRTDDHIHPPPPIPPKPFWKPKPRVKERNAALDAPTITPATTHDSTTPRIVKPKEKVKRKSLPDFVPAEAPPPPSEVRHVVGMGPGFSVLPCAPFLPYVSFFCWQCLLRTHSPANTHTPTPLTTTTPCCNTHPNHALFTCTPYTRNHDTALHNATTITYTNIARNGARHQHTPPTHTTNTPYPHHTHLVSLRNLPCCTGRMCSVGWT
jgi:hypothetical protein